MITSVTLWLSDENCDNMCGDKKRKLGIIFHVKNLQSSFIKRHPFHRHQLMKIQKELRIRSAADKRRLLDLRKRQKRRGLLGHHRCTDEDQDNYKDSYHNGLETKLPFL